MVSLNYRDSRPIYEQIKDGLRSLILTGALAQGERLPSVREMATQLAINPNTIQRAYRELEAEGYIYSVPGKGSFAGGGDAARESRLAELFKELEQTAEKLRELGVGDSDIIARIGRNSR